MSDSEKDPQLFLPPAMAAQWVVVPRRSLVWLAVQCLVLGAGVALSVGSAFGFGWWPAFLVAIGIMILVALPMRRRETELIAGLPDCPAEKEAEKQEGISV